MLFSRAYAAIVERGACVRSQGAPNRPPTGILPVHGQGAGVGELEFGTSQARGMRLQITLSCSKEVVSGYG